MIRILTSAFAIILFASACSIEPEPINYGKEGCHFCSMTIVDNQHASELVTKKGKVFKYDAIECMINDLKKRERLDIELFLVNDYSDPGKLISAENAFYLISEGVPSPMGAFLSGFSDIKKASSLKENKGGEVYNWTEVQKQVR